MKQLAVLRSAVLYTGYSSGNFVISCKMALCNMAKPLTELVGQGKDEQM